MTTYATRSPLQLVTNTAYAMSSGRRSSARLAEKEDPTKPEAAAPTRKDAAAPAKGKAGANGAARRGKRKLDYDEDDGGFLFTRKTTKRTRPSKGSAAEPSADEPEPELQPLQVRKARKKSPPGDEPNAPPARRGARTSGGTTTVAAKGPRSKAPAKKFRPEDDAAADARARTPDATTKGDVTKIALPFADTPVIRRNKEMRKGGAGGGGDGARRSSLSMRGRRASSLIDSGTSNAMPHAEVAAGEFYKHIESGLPEPRRMKQLLTWCATRALGAKPGAGGGSDGPARLAAHEIKQQLLNDFSTHSEMSDWFGREDHSHPQAKLRPNPRNVANQAKIDDLSARLARLKAERQTWTTLLHPPIPALPSLPTNPSASSIPTALLAPPDLGALALLAPASDPAASTAPSLSPQPAPSTSTIPARTTAIATRAEFAIDQLADAAHALAQHLQHAERAGRTVLRGAAAALDARAARREGREGEGEGEGREAGGVGVGVGTRDVLRALSRVVER